jgi:hypothetical protein
MHKLDNLQVMSWVMHDLFTYTKRDMLLTDFKIQLYDSYMNMLKDKAIYRVELHPDGTVQTLCYDLMDGFSPKLNNFYESVDELPKWVQDILSVLMVIDHTKVNHPIEKVGRRISEHIFWVYDEEDDGINTRSESEEGSTPSVS